MLQFVLIVVVLAVWSACICMQIVICIFEFDLIASVVSGGSYCCPRCCWLLVVRCSWMLQLLGLMLQLLLLLLWTSCPRSFHSWSTPEAALMATTTFILRPVRFCRSCPLCLLMICFPQLLIFAEARSSATFRCKLSNPGAEKRPSAIQVQLQGETFRFC